MAAENENELAREDFRAAKQKAVAALADGMGDFDVTGPDNAFVQLTNLARQIVDLIAEGKIPNVTLNY